MSTGRLYCDDIPAAVDSRTGDGPSDTHYVKTTAEPARH